MWVKASDTIRSSGSLKDAFVTVKINVTGKIKLTSSAHSWLFSRSSVKSCAFYDPSTSSFVSKTLPVFVSRFDVITSIGSFLWAYTTAARDVTGERFRTAYDVTAACYHKRRTQRNVFSLLLPVLVLRSVFFFLLTSFCVLCILLCFPSSYSLPVTGPVSS
jgi:hypothetical protein